MRRWLIRITLLLLALSGLAVFAAWLLLRGSLPVLDGELALPGLSAPVTVRRDALGTVTIDAASETDAMRALGYVHAQDRYFEMDLMRRTAAGELAELFGPIALDVDKQHRMHRMRARVMRDLDRIAGDKLPQLQAYVDGVNAGVAGLEARPWPYLLLDQQPKPWLLADSALTGYAMYFDLQDSTDTRELALWRIKQHVPPALFALLARDGTAWDAPLSGAPRGDAVLPKADQLDLRKLPMADGGKVEDSALALTPPPALRMVPLSPALRERGNGGPPAAADLSPGSNNFAVSGALTADGRAIVANDMHLGLRAPNIWFRARLRYPDARAPGGKVDVSGFTLPGLPGVIVGSNGHVAWGFTNSYVDTTDWLRVRPCGKSRPPVVDTQPACTPLAKHREEIAVAGGAPVTLDVEETPWGPILQREADGSALALRWVAHLPGSLNLGVSDFSLAGDLQQLMAIADRSALPTQNLVAADRDGHIAWRLLGPLPDRSGWCSAQKLVENAGDTPASPVVRTAKDSARRGYTHLPPTRREPCYRWEVVTNDAPVDANPATGRLWTANNRVLDGTELRRVGDAGYALGARAKQIRDDLFARDKFTERDLLAIQLDDRALFLQRWWQLLRDTATEADSPALTALAKAAPTLPERATTDSTGYRIVRAWRLAVLARIADGLTAPARAASGQDFIMPKLPQLEGVAWPLVTQRPVNLAPRRFAKCAPDAAEQSQCGIASWQALFEDAAREVRDELDRQGTLAQRTWGERNTARICHPLADSIPWLGKRWLCMPPDQLPGDVDMPRVAAPAFGASERMVVSPGREADGIVHMPGGQSGHPLSPFWGAGHEDWVHGRATPFLPGKTEHFLTLHP